MAEPCTYCKGSGEDPSACPGCIEDCARCGGSGEEPVSASRPPEAGLEALTDLYDAIQPRDGSMPDMDTIRLIAELRYPELRAGLGDRQLTALADNLERDLRRLASGENPDG